MPHSPYFYLLDNNVFRLLCASEGGAAIKAFNACISSLPNGPATGSAAAIQLTPATLLEAIGVVPPLPVIQIPKTLIQPEKCGEIMDFVLEEARAFYKSHPEMSKSALVSKASEQRKFSTKEAAKLFDACVTRVVKSRDFEQAVYSVLAFDYLYKFDYPKAVRAAMHRFFVPHFFIDDEMVSGLAKFRLAKQLWDVALSELRSCNDGRPDFEQAKTAMRIKTRRDLLDCDLVHLLCTGVRRDGKSYPVAAFTTDDRRSVLPRIAVYKGILEVMLDLCPPASKADALPLLTPKPDNALVLCHKDGSFEEILPLRNIKTVK